MNFLDLLVESYGTWLLRQRRVDASKDSDIPKNVPFALAINNRNTRLGHSKECSICVCNKQPKHTCAPLLSLSLSGYARTVHACAHVHVPLVMNTISQ